MDRPYITCYMMTSVDGRIDCEMTGSLPGVEEYYLLLDTFAFDAVVSGRVTAERRFRRCSTERNTSL